LAVNPGGTDIEWGGFVGARAYRSTNQTLADSTETAIAFDAESFDTSTVHDNATNNSRFVLNRIGKWRVRAQARFAATGTGSRDISIRKNGATTLQYQAGLPHATIVVTFAIEDIVDSTATTDYVEIMAYQNSGGDLALSGVASSTNCSVEYLGP
jgi:hypothetical protein